MEMTIKSNPSFTACRCRFILMNYYMGGSVAPNGVEIERSEEGGSGNS
jgi:hypothetical protein